MDDVCSMVRWGKDGLECTEIISQAEKSEVQSPAQPEASSNQAHRRHTASPHTLPELAHSQLTSFSASALWCAWWQGAPGGRRIWLKLLPFKLPAFCLERKCREGRRERERESDRDRSRQSSFTEKWRPAVFSLLLLSRLLFPLLSHYPACILSISAFFMYCPAFVSLLQIISLNNSSIDVLEKVK